jgi:hypothetical protein
MFNEEKCTEIGARFEHSPQKSLKGDQGFKNVSMNCHQASEIETI